MQLNRARTKSEARLIFNPDHGKTEIKIERLLDEYAIGKSVVLRSNDPDGRQRWVPQCRLTARHSREFLSELVEIPEVYAIER